MTWNILDICVVFLHYELSFCAGQAYLKMEMTWHIRNIYGNSHFYDGSYDADVKLDVKRTSYILNNCTVFLPCEFYNAFSGSLNLKRFCYTLYN